MDTVSDAFSVVCSHKAYKIIHKGRFFAHMMFMGFFSNLGTHLMSATSGQAVQEHPLFSIYNLWLVKVTAVLDGNFTSSREIQKHFFLGNLDLATSRCNNVCFFCSIK